MYSSAFVIFVSFFILYLHATQIYVVAREKNDTINGKELSKWNTSQSIPMETEFEQQAKLMVEKYFFKRNFKHYFTLALNIMKITSQHAYTDIENVCPDVKIKNQKDMPLPEKLEHINRTRDIWIGERDPKYLTQKRLMHRYKKWYCLLTSPLTSLNNSQWITRWGSSWEWVERLRTSMDSLYSVNQRQYESRGKFDRVVSATIARTQLFSVQFSSTLWGSVFQSACCAQLRVDFVDILLEWVPTWYLTEEHINLFNILRLAYEPQYTRKMQFLRARNSYKEKPEDEYDEVVIPYCDLSPAV